MDSDPSSRPIAVPVWRCEHCDRRFEEGPTEDLGDLKESLRSPTRPWRSHACSGLITGYAPLVGWREIPGR